MLDERVSVWASRFLLISDSPTHSTPHVYRVHSQRAALAAITPWGRKNTPLCMWKTAILMCSVFHLALNKTFSTCKFEKQGILYIIFEIRERRRKKVLNCVSLSQIRTHSFSEKHNKNITPAPLLETLRQKHSLEERLHWIFKMNSIQSCVFNCISPVGS